MKKTGLLVLVLLFAAIAFGEDNLLIATQGVKLVRDNAKDPDSLVIERIFLKTDRKPDHPQMCIRFRARNAMGGFVREMAEYKGGTNLIPNADQGFSPCNGIERRWDWMSKHGWVDLTDEYAKKATVSAEPSKAR